MNAAAQMECIAALNAYTSCCSILSNVGVDSVFETAIEKNYYMLDLNLVCVQGLSKNLKSFLTHFGYF